jgi:hypothetical protein
MLWGELMSSITSPVARSYALALVFVVLHSARGGLVLAPIIGLFAGAIGRQRRCKSQTSLQVSASARAARALEKRELGATGALPVE